MFRFMINARIVLALAQLPLAAATCESLKSLAIPHTTITLAQPISAGQFTMPAGTPPPFPGAPGPNFKDLPAFCRVSATAMPTSDSEIKIEVWMPVSGWNGKLQSVGNGAWAGSIGYAAMATALTAGYASAGTDTGHQGNTAEFAAHHPEQ